MFKKRQRGWESERSGGASRQKRGKQLNSAYDKVTTITVDGQYLTNDKRCSPAYMGASSRASGGGLVTLSGAMGSGKTTVVNNYVVHTTGQEGDPRPQAVCLSPLISLAWQQTRQLEDLAPATTKVVNYLDSIRSKTTQDTEWSMLLVCPYSLHHFALPLKIAMFVIDEASCVYKQLVDWNRKDDRNSSSNAYGAGRQGAQARAAREIVRAIASRSEVIMLCCAQMTDEMLSLYMELFGFDDQDGKSSDRPMPVVKYKTSWEGQPLTDVVVVRSIGRLVQLISEAASEDGELVAVCTNVASFGRRLQRHLDTLKRPDGTPINTVAWDSAWLTARRQEKKSNPASDVGEWMVVNGVHVLVHTTAMSPGMSIDGNVVTKRFMYLGAHGAGAQEMGQMPDRVRNISDRTIFAHSAMKAEKTRTPDADSDRAWAIKQVLEDYPEETMTCLPEGRAGSAQDTVRPSAMNEYRIANRIKRRLNHYTPTVEETVEWMGDKTRITEGDETEVALPDGWHDALDKGVAYNTKFLSRNQLQKIAKTDPSGDPSIFLQTEAYTCISELLPRFAVRDSEYTLEHSLAPAAYRLIAGKEGRSGYNKLRNYTALAEGGTSQRHESSILAMSVYPDHGTTLSLPTSKKIARSVQALIVLVGSERVDTSTLTGMAVVAPANTPEQRKIAYNWLVQPNVWKFLESLTVRVRKRLNLVDGPPPLESATGDQWSDILKYLLVTQLGIGCRTKGGGKGKKNDVQMRADTLRLVPTGFWAQMAVDMPFFTSWIQSEQAKTFGPLPVEFTSCFACDGLGSDNAECYVQVDVRLCIRHQDLSAPIDTPPFREDQRLLPMSDGPIRGQQGQLLLVEQQDEKDEDKEEEEEEYIVDRLLRYVGYEEGRKSTNKISVPSMKEAVQKSSALTNVEVQRVKQLYNVDISGWNKSNSMKDVKLRLQQILKRDIHTEVKMVQAQSRGSGHAKTSFWKLQ